MNCLNLQKSSSDTLFIDSTDSDSIESVTDEEETISENENSVNENMNAIAAMLKFQMMNNKILDR